MVAKNLSERIREFIMTNIGSGLWTDGYRIPSEAEIMHLFQASRMTVHRAIKELAAEGRLVRERGRGTFVSKTVPRSELLNVRDIAEEIVERGGSYFGEVKQLGKAEETALTKYIFGADSVHNVARSILVHHENGEPLQLEDRYVHLDHVPGYLEADFSQMTPHQYLMQKAPLQKAEHELTAVLPSPSQQEFLTIRQGDPCLLLKRKTWSGDTLVSYAELLYPASRYSFGGVFTPAK